MDITYMPGETTAVENSNFSLIGNENDKFCKKENVIFNNMWVFVLLLIKDVQTVSKLTHLLPHSNKNSKLRTPEVGRLVKNALLPTDPHVNHHTCW